MAFQNIKPHHIKHPDHGWLTHEHIELLPELAGRISHEEFIGGPPDASYQHDVEVDVSTQLQGYMRLTDEELAERRTEAEAYDKAAQDLAAERERDLDLIQQRAKDDPAFAALARLHGYLQKPE